VSQNKQSGEGVDPAKAPVAERVQGPATAEALAMEMASEMARRDLRHREPLADPHP
jgi:hypothetical protein